MPRSPLGRQLHLVLASIGPAVRGSYIFTDYANAKVAQSAPIWNAVHDQQSVAASQTRGYHVYSVRRSAAAAIASEPENFTTQRPRRETAPRPRLLSRRRLNRRTRVDRITEALKDAGNEEVAPAVRKKKRDLSHLNVRERDGRRESAFNARRHRTDFIPDLPKSKQLSLERVLASCIQHQAAVPDVGEAEWMKPPFELSSGESALLDAKGYTLDDIQVWANIVSNPDPLETAKVLTQRIRTHGPHSIPVFLLLYIVRRPYLSARALRTIIHQTWTILEHRKQFDQGDVHVPTDAIFMIFTRLLRHAREVWPVALESLSGLLLQYLPRMNADDEELSNEQLETLTYMLNKAMRMIAIPTAVEPYKNNVFQEAAVIRFLRFMAEHDPPLQINREGYRAVVLVQLAQGKTPKEQRWAELKTLSWPPWKEARTAMDADITREFHGMSKASETLARMREAGYGALEWEMVASIYAGWDVDGTPTVQTRVLLGPDGVRFKNLTTRWAARITTTRTAQEAWAYFLAYEDEKMPPDQDVYLALFRKLHKEQQREERFAHSKGNQQTVLYTPGFSGDTREVEPLPPSTHLYTYTRTTPPTFDGFYRQLQERGIVLEGHCLAFLIAKAGSLRRGIEYLIASELKHPSVRDLLTLDPSHDLTEIPMPVFAGLVELLSRFSNVPVSSALPEVLGTVNRPAFLAAQTLDQQTLDSNHALVHALELLKLRRPLFRPAWNSVLRALGNESSSQNIHAAILRRTTDKVQSLTHDMDKWWGAITAYRLMRKVLVTMREFHLDLDIHGFQAYCQAAENAAVGCWKILREDETKVDGRRDMPQLGAAVEMVRSKSHLIRLKREFWNLVGDDDDLKEIEGDSRIVRPTSARVPRLLEIPGPALLHAYIRALGWIADYQGMIETLRWMVANHSELAEKRERDRNGEAMMRRTLVAVRAFLERRWVPANVSPRPKHLARLEILASAEVLDEARELVDSVWGWRGWPEDDEVDDYCRDARFQGF